MCVIVVAIVFKCIDQFTVWFYHMSLIISCIAIPRNNASLYSMAKLSCKAMLHYYAKWVDPGNGN